MTAAEHSQAPRAGEGPDPMDAGPGAAGGNGGGTAESGAAAAPIPRGTAPRVRPALAAGTAHAAVADPGLPDAGQGACCIGAAVYGPGRCTCWVSEYDLEQQPADEYHRRSLAAGFPPPVRPSMCSDCAYRPGSPEKLDDPEHAADAESLEHLAATGTPFYCHDGVRRVVRRVHPSGASVPGHPAAYDPLIVDGRPYRADGTPEHLCAGWAARARALEATR